MNWLDVQTALLDGAVALVQFGVNWLLQSTLLIAIGVAAARLLAGRGSAVQSAVYRTTLAAVLACPMVSWSLSHSGISGWSLAVPKPWSSNERELAMAEIPQSVSSAEISELAAEGALSNVEAPLDPILGSEREASSDGEGLDSASPNRAETPRRAAEPWNPVWAFVSRSVEYLGFLAVAFGAVWIVISAVRLAGLALAWWRLARLCRGASRANPAAAASCQDLAARLGVAAPSVLHSPYLLGPCLAGLRRPVILLPERDLGPRLRHVLVHELAHLVRRDCYWNLLRHVGLSIFFFQPLLWVLSRRLEATAEEVCDDYAVHYGGDREAYAYCLIEVAEFATAPPVAAGVGIISLRSMLAHRVGRIMDTSRPLSTRIGNLLLGLVVIGGLAGMAIVGPLGIVARHAAADSSPPAEVKVDEPPAAAPQPAAAAAPVPTAIESAAHPRAAKVAFHRMPMKLSTAGDPEISALAFSANDELIAVGGGGSWQDQLPGQVRVLNFAKREPVASYDTSRGIQSVCLSPDGQRVAYGTWSGEVWLREIGGAELLHAQMDGAARVAMSPDGELLVVATENGEMKTWDAVDGRLIRGFASRGFSSYWVGFSPDGKYLVATGGKAEEQGGPKLMAWDVETRQHLYKQTAEPGRIFWGAISPDSKTLATAGSNSVALWDLATGERRGQTEAGAQPIDRVAFSPDGKHLVSDWLKSGKSQVNLWDLASGKVVGEFAGHRGHVRTFVFSRDGTQLITGGVDRSVRLWNVADQKQTGTLLGPQAAPDAEGAPVATLAAAFAPDGNGLATAQDDGQLNLYNLSSPGLTRSWPAHGDAVAALVYAPGGAVLVSGGYDKTVKFWNPATGELIRSLAGHTGWVVSLAFSHDGKTLASGSYDQTIRLWNVADGTEIKSFTGHSATVRSLAFSHDDQLLASGSADRTVRLWNVASGAALPALTGHAAAVRGIAFSPDDQLLASAGEDKLIKIWNVGTHQLQGTLAGHTDMISALAFAEGTLITSSWDRTVRTWDAAALEPGEKLVTGRSEIVALAVSPGGRRLLAVGADQSLTFFKGDRIASPVVQTRPLAEFRDDFLDKYDPSWKILREDNSHLSLTKNPGCLTITTQMGTIYGPASTAPNKRPARNIFLHPAPTPDMGDYSITLAVSGFEPTAFLQQVALLCYNDDDTYLKWSFEHREEADATNFVMVRETEAEVQHDLLLKMPPPEKLWLRLTKRGNDYEGAYSIDGKDFKTVVTRPWGGGPPQYVGFVAKNGRNNAADQIDVCIESFELTAPAKPAE